MSHRSLRVASAGLLTTLAVVAPASSALAAPSVTRAAAVQQRADRAVVSAAHGVAACHRSCAGADRVLQTAGQRLAVSTAQVARLGRVAGAGVDAPVVTAVNGTLRWRPVPGQSRYVVARRVTGLTTDYAVVTGTTASPAAAPGRTVTVRVRAAVKGSAWSAPKTLSYPAAPIVSPKAAPILTVDGQRLSWTRVAAVTSYVLLRRVEGQPDAYSLVRGTSVTPHAVPGKTARYEVRTAVSGAAWSAEASVEYPAATASTPPAPTTPAPTTPARTTPAPTTPPSTTPASTTPAPTDPAPTAPPATFTGSSTGTRVGLVVGSAQVWELSFAQTLGARSARMEFPIDASVSDLAGVVDAYARAGIQVDLLAGFAGRVPTAAESANLATWAAAFGPGGSFWQGKDYPASLAVDRIEFGNESSGPWQYAQLNGVQDWAHSQAYSDIAAGYGASFSVAAQAIAAANDGVRLLAVGDVAGRWSSWMDGIFRGAPQLASEVGGWVVHPYGPQWAMNIDTVLDQARSHGASDSIPLYATETGVASDDGRCLNDNYGWDRCLTYGQAATTLRTAVEGMKARYGDRLREVDLYAARDQQAPGASTDREGYFGGLDASGGTKGAYTSTMHSLLTDGI